MRKLILAVAALLAACTTTKQTPSLVLVNGTVFTDDSQKQWAQAVAIQGERILATGSSAEMRALAGPETRVIDVEGRTIVPGFNDAHVHVPFFIDAIEVPPLPRDATATQLLDAIAAAARTATPDRWLHAQTSFAMIDDPHLTLAALDAIAPAQPVVLSNDAGHAFLFNTAGLRKAGITSSDGWAYENTVWTKEREWLDAMPDAQLNAVIRQFADEAVRYGITSVQSMPTLSGARIASLKLDLPLRWRWMVMQFGTVEEHPKMAVKYILDGTPVEHGASLRQPYIDRPSSRGWMNYDDAQLHRILEVAAHQDQPLLLHIAGDLPLEKVFAEMRRIHADWPAKRVRIEHGDFISSFLDDAQRFGVVIVQNPAHFTIRDLVEARYGVARVERFQIFRSLLDRGIPVAIGSDGPINPWLNVMFATIHPTNPLEAMTREQAVRAYTKGSAFAEFQENEKGTIAPGKLADLAVLSQDIFTVPASELPKTESVLTIVGGKIVWEKH